MIKGIVSSLVVAAIVCCMFWASSCTTGGNPYPTIVFRLKTDSTSNKSSYVSLPRDTTFMLIVSASKTGPDGLLKDFKITRSINGGADSTLIDAIINTTNFAQFYSYKTGDSGNIEQYTFTVGNAEGLKTSIQFTDTVK